MRISAKAEYACIAMLELAANHAEPHPVRVKDIADAHDIPQRFLVQILLQMKGAGLVISVRGAAGGYQLARPPEEISLGDIINAIDRVQQPGERRPSPKRRLAVPAGASAATQALQSVWRDIQQAEQTILQERTLADLVRQTQQSNALSYQI